MSLYCIFVQNLIMDDYTIGGLCYSKILKNKTTSRFRTGHIMFSGYIYLVLKFKFTPVTIRSY